VAELGNLFVNIGAKLDSEGFKKATKSIGDIGASVRKVGIGMSVAGAAIVGTSVAMVNSWAKAGDEVEKMSRRIGFSTESLSELKHAAELSGTSLRAVESATKRMSRTIIDAGDGLSTATRALARLNLTAEELQILSPEKQFEKLSEAIADLENPTIKAAVAQEIFGRGGMDLLPMLTDGAVGLRAMRKEARDLGIVFREEAAKKAAKFQDDMLRLKRSIDSVKFGIAEGLLPVLTDWIVKGKEIILKVSTWIKENKELFGTVAKITLTIGGLLVVLGPLLIILGQMAIGIGALTTAITIAKAVTIKFFAVLLAHPFVAITVAIAGATLALILYLEKKQEASQATIELGNTTQSLINIQKKEMESLKKIATDSKITQEERESALLKYHRVRKNVARLEKKLEEEKTSVVKKEAKKVEQIVDTSWQKQLDTGNNTIDLLSNKLTLATGLRRVQEEETTLIFGEKWVEQFIAVETNVDLMADKLGIFNDFRIKTEEDLTEAVLESGEARTETILEQWQRRADKAAEVTSQLTDTATAFSDFQIVNIKNNTKDTIDAEIEKFNEKKRWINENVSDETERNRQLNELEQGHAAAIENIKEEGTRAESRRRKALKPFMIAEAIANTAQGATKAIGQGGFFGLFMAAAVIAAGLAQVATIQAQRFAEGGMALGPLAGIMGEEGKEVALPLEHPNTVRALAGALQMATAAGGGGVGSFTVVIPPISTRQEAKRMGDIVGASIFKKLKKSRRI